jgi:hypothetical protein
MKMKNICSHCNAVCSIPDEYIGCNIKCPKCKKEFTVQQPLSSNVKRPWVAIGLGFVIVAAISFYLGSFVNQNKFLSNDKQSKNISDTIKSDASSISRNTENPLKTISLNNANTDANKRPQKSNQNQALQAVRELNKRLIEKVTCSIERGETDGYKQKIIVTVSNNSDHLFKGKITVRALDIAGDRVDWDILLFDDDGIGPDGSQKLGILWFKNPLRIHSFQYDVAGTFEAVAAPNTGIAFEEISRTQRPNVTHVFIYTPNIDENAIQKIIQVYARRYASIPLVVLSFFNNRQNAGKTTPLDDAALQCCIGACDIQNGVPQKFNRNPDFGRVLKPQEDIEQRKILVDPPRWQLEQIATLSPEKVARVKALIDRFSDRTLNISDVATLTYEEKKLIDEVPLLQTFFEPIFKAYTESMLNNVN